MYKRESDDISTEYGLMEEKCVELDSIFHLPGEGGNDSSREVFYQHKSSSSSRNFKWKLPKPQIVMMSLHQLHTQRQLTLEATSGSQDSSAVHPGELSLLSSWPSSAPLFLWPLSSYPISK
jgi:hypothetical protein